MSVFKEEQGSGQDLFDIFLVSSEIKERSCDQQPTICLSSKVANLNNRDEYSSQNESPKDVAAYQLQNEVLMEETEKLKRETIKEEEDQFIPPNTATETQTDELKLQKTDRLTCALCKKGCTSEDDLSSHLQSHLKNSTPNVKSEDMSSSVKREVSNVQSQPKEKESCSNVPGVPSKKRLITKKKRSVRSAIQCTDCGKTLGSKAALYTHRSNMHRNKEWFECKICKKSFRHKLSYERHGLVHSGVKPHKCEKCNKKFSTTGNLKDHMRLHDPEDQYDCAYCGKKFTHKTNLKSEAPHSGTTHR